ncbi:MAG TPA: LptE family protein [Gemmatales bacterium]|nr:LptE family protein [Gemmatales bacterium]
MSRKVLPLITLLLLAGCTGEGIQEWNIFGYSLGPRSRPNIKTVRVPIFRNTTFFRDLEYELTQAVIKRIEDTTPYKVVNDRADAELLGTIRVGSSHVLLQNELNQARSRDFTLIVEVSFVDTRTGQDYFLPVTLQPAINTSPLPSPQTDVIESPAPVPVHHLRPMIFSKTAPYAQELGQSFATAKQQVLNELAISIVNAMESPW